MKKIKEWSIVVAMAIFTALLIYTGDFLGCYQMRTMSTSCEWFIDIQNKL